MKFNVADRANLRMTEKKFSTMSVGAAVNHRNSQPARLRKNSQLRRAHGECPSHAAETQDDEMHRSRVAGFDAIVVERQLMHEQLPHLRIERVEEPDDGVRLLVPAGEQFLERLARFGVTHLNLALQRFRTFAR